MSSRKAWLTPTDTGDGDVCRPLVVPSGFLPAVSTLLEELTHERNWEADGSYTPADAAAAMRAMVDNYYLGCEVFHDDNGRDIDVPIWVVTTTNTTWLWQSVTGQPTGGWFRMPNAVASGGYVELPFSAKAAQYKLKLLFATDNNLGDGRAQVDGTTRASFSLYTAAQVLQWIVTSSTFTIAADGAHTLKIETQGKQPSSSSNRIALSAARLEWQSW